MYKRQINFYRRFLPGIARTLQPLTNALKGNPKTLEWTPAAVAAFLSAKAALVAAVPLAHPAPDAVLSLATDASDTHVGAKAGPGAHSPFSQESCKAPGCSTPSSTGSCSPPSAPSATSGSCWKAAVSASSLTTSR